MSDLSLPISLSRFVEALKSLPSQNLELKVAELRNSIAHLDYSNQQLKVFIQGYQESSNSQQDQDYVDAIKENESLIARNLEKIKLLRIEYQDRGIDWIELHTDNESEPTDGEAIRSGKPDRADMESPKRNNEGAEYLRQDGGTYIGQESTHMTISHGDSNQGDGPQNNTLQY